LISTFFNVKKLYAVNKTIIILIVELSGPSMIITGFRYRLTQVIVRRLMVVPTYV
jgi:hypothetical protein